jgi:dTDP-4-amino-4,6-dideoxygalactose transaminase
MKSLLAALGRVLQTQQFNLGAEVAAFEKAAAEKLGVSHALGCSLGTDALWLALAAAGLGPGRAIVTTPFSFFASVSSILRAGATPVLADIDPVSFNLSPAEGDFPEAAREVPAPPIFPELREDEQQAVVAAIAEFLS